MEQELGPNIIMKLTDAILEPPELTKFERFRNFFDRSLFSLFAPAVYILIGILLVILSIYVSNIQNSFVRFVLLLLTVLIAVGVVISVIVYTTLVPIDSILGVIVRERYVSNVLAGVYFGTQVVRWVFSLYFYDESSEQSQSSAALKFLFVFFVLVCLAQYLPILWSCFYS